MTEPAGWIAEPRERSPAAVAREYERLRRYGDVRSWMADELHDALDECLEILRDLSAIDSGEPVTQSSRAQRWQRAHDLFNDEESTQ